jgi:hypothetical protein
MISDIRRELKSIYESCKTENEWLEKSRETFNRLHNNYTELDIDRVASFVQELYDNQPFKKEIFAEFNPDFDLVASVKTSYVTIHMAGELQTAIQCAREYTYEHGACFQITPCDYVYTGGKECGITARVICYPRFPKSDEVLLKEARDFAYILAKKLCQKSFSIETSNETHYFQSNNPLHGK